LHDRKTHLVLQARGEEPAAAQPTRPPKRRVPA
jgi:hypothetical protein